MRLLFVGDVVGRPGRRALRELLPGMRREHAVDLTIVNIENAAGGFGVTPDVLAEFEPLAIDCYTTGNHIWDKKPGVALLDEVPNLLRPANYPDANPGTGLYVGATESGTLFAVINLEGRVFMKSLACPFEIADELLATLAPEIKVIFVDFHAEATSEKQALGYHLDGRVSGVVGTHTHVPTGDERVLPNGTAYLTDVGMTGPYDSIIGMRADKALRRFLVQTPTPLEVAKRDVRLAAVLIDIDESTGRAQALERMLIPNE